MRPAAYPSCVAPLDRADVVAFLATADVARAREYFSDVIGLRVLGDDPFACTFDANGTVLRVVAVPDVVVAPYTALGWIVDDIAETVDSLQTRGVDFERFEGMQQDERGVWEAPGGDMVAWFKDPDGNTLSLTELAAAG
jgi:catechol 2,3-dioxygenase-like lactoylglutathione lyase family enzyme